MADIPCPACGTDHSTRMHEADEQDPRLEPWKSLLDASGEHPQGDHLLLIALKDEGNRTEMLLTGMDDPIAQVDMMGRIVTSIMAESGDVNGARAIGGVVSHWRDVLLAMRQEAQIKTN